MRKGVEQLVIEQMIEVQTKHPNLELIRNASGVLYIQGRVGFTMEHKSHTIEDSYNLEFKIPWDYPDSPPAVYETEGKVTKDFEHFMAAGNFCLEAPVEVRRRFAEHKNLLRFIDDQVIPYLFNYSYKRDYGTLPFGERAHGALGLLEYYKEFFETSGIDALKLLKCLADGLTAPFMICPCGKGRKLKDCHGPKLDELRSHLPAKWFEKELQEMIQLAKKEKIPLPESKVLPKRVLKNRKRSSNRKKKQKQKK